MPRPPRVSLARARARALPCYLLSSDLSLSYASVIHRLGQKDLHAAVVHPGAIPGDEATTSALLASRCNRVKEKREARILLQERARPYPR